MSTMYTLAISVDSANSRLFERFDSVMLLYETSMGKKKMGYIGYYLIN